MTTTTHDPTTLPLRVAVITGSTRPGRQAEAVARWVHEVAAGGTTADVELVDLAEQALPHLDEPLPPLAGHHEHAHTRAWAAVIAGFDAFVFVTPEYNHSMPGALKNAIDFLYGEWNDKAAGFVSYGVDGGLRAVEHLRGVMGELKVADVRTHVVLTFADDFEDHVFAPSGGRDAEVVELLDEVVRWAAVLRPLRSPAPAGRPA